MCILIIKKCFSKKCKKWIQRCVLICVWIRVYIYICVYITHIRNAKVNLLLDAKLASTTEWNQLHLTRQYLFAFLRSEFQTILNNVFLTQYIKNIVI